MEQNWRVSVSGSSRLVSDGGSSKQRRRRQLENSSEKRALSARTAGMAQSAIADARRQRAPPRGAPNALAPDTSRHPALPAVATEGASEGAASESRSSDDALRADRHPTSEVAHHRSFRHRSGPATVGCAKPVDACCVLATQARACFPAEEDAATWRVSPRRELCHRAPSAAQACRPGAGPRSPR